MVWWYDGLSVALNPEKEHGYCGFVRSLQLLDPAWMSLRCKVRASQRVVHSRIVICLKRGGAISQMNMLWISCYSHSITGKATNKQLESYKPRLKFPELNFTGVPFTHFVCWKKRAWDASNEVELSDILVRDIVLGKFLTDDRNGSNIRYRWWETRGLYKINKRSLNKI